MINCRNSNRLRALCIWGVFLFTQSLRADQSIINSISRAEPDQEKLNQVLNAYYSSDDDQVTSATDILKSAIQNASSTETKVRLLAIYGGKQDAKICEMLINMVKEPQDPATTFAAVNLIGNQKLDQTQIEELLNYCSTIDTEIGQEMIHGPQVGNSLLLSIARAGGPAAFADVKEYLSRDDVTSETKSMAHTVYSVTDAPEAIPLLLEMARKCDLRQNYMTVSTYSALSATLSRQCRKMSSEDRSMRCQPVIDMLLNCLESNETHPEVREIAYLGLAQILSASKGQFASVKATLEQSNADWQNSKSAANIRRFIDQSHDTGE